MFINTNIKLTADQEFFLEVVTDLWNKALAQSVKKYAQIKGKTIVTKSRYISSKEPIYKTYVEVLDKMISELQKGKLLGFFSFQQKGKIIHNNKEMFIKFLGFLKQKQHLSDELFANNVEKQLIAYCYFPDTYPGEVIPEVHESAKVHIKKIYNRFYAAHPMQIK